MCPKRTLNDDGSDLEDDAGLAAGRDGHGGRNVALGSGGIGPTCWIGWVCRTG
jgi:hypothetical protein